MALQLLDSDFHDENIRAFAVEVLEKKLLDENLEDYVLQLTQVGNDETGANKLVLLLVHAVPPASPPSPTTTTKTHYLYNT